MSFPDPAAAEAAFYEAFSTLDLTQMRTVWLDSERASCIHPGAGLLQGIDTIMASWAAMFDNSQIPQVEHRLIQVSRDTNLTVHTVAENVSTDSGRRSALILATNVYIRIDDRWHMLAHHASLPLINQEQDQEQQPPPLH
jgi:ketosteroid isomerase-like protein